jgi:hypothetical protein
MKIIPPKTICSQHYIFKRLFTRTKLLGACPCCRRTDRFHIRALSEHGEGAQVLDDMKDGLTFTAGLSLALQLGSGFGGSGKSMDFTGAAPSWRLMLEHYLARPRITKHYVARSVWLGSVLVVQRIGDGPKSSRRSTRLIAYCWGGYVH